MGDRGVDIVTRRTCAPFTLLLEASLTNVVLGRSERTKIAEAPAPRGNESRNLHRPVACSCRKKIQKTNNIAATGILLRKYEEGKLEKGEHVKNKEFFTVKKKVLSKGIIYTLRWVADDLQEGRAPHKF